jgi:hypothetical protein
VAKDKIRWRRVPGTKDFRAATAYLSLVLSDEQAAAVVRRLRRAPTTYQKPKDLERASGVKLLPPDDPEVRKKPKKSRGAKPLSPVLLVRGSASDGRPLIIGDGYHRICASYHVDREADIPCRIVDL